MGNLFAGDENHCLAKARGKTFVALFTQVGVPKDSHGYYEGYDVAGTIRLRQISGDQLVGFAIHEYLHAIDESWTDAMIRPWVYELQDLLSDAIDSNNRALACRLALKWTREHSEFFKDGDSRGLIALLWSNGVRRRLK